MSSCVPLSDTSTSSCKSVKPFTTITSDTHTASPSTSRALSWPPSTLNQSETALKSASVTSILQRDTPSISIVIVSPPTAPLPSNVAASKFSSQITSDKALKESGSVNTLPNINFTHKADLLNFARPCLPSSAMLLSSTFF